MTRTQAWRKVAAAFERNSGKNGDREELVRFGLCYALDNLGFGNAYSQVAQLGYAIQWPAYRRKNGDEFRATFAALMAAMTQRERDQLVEGL